MELMFISKSVYLFLIWVKRDLNENFRPNTVVVFVLIAVNIAAVIYLWLKLDKNKKTLYKNNYIDYYEKDTPENLRTIKGNVFNTVNYNVDENNKLNF